VITDETWTLSLPLPPAVRYIFWDCEGISLTEFMAAGTTITSEVYRETLNKLRSLIIIKTGTGYSLKALFSCTTHDPTPQLTQIL